MLLITDITPPTQSERSAYGRRQTAANLHMRARGNHCRHTMREPFRAFAELELAAPDPTPGRRHGTPALLDLDHQVL